jgi:mannose-6-phosphate isomerase-like protein (cupin superfamily)
MAQQESEIKTKHQINPLTTFGDDGVEIVNDDTYMIIDLPIKDRQGYVRETVSNTVLYPNKHTSGHKHDKLNEHYHFKKGSGLLMLHGEDYMEIKEIQPESHAFIEKGVWHQVINTSKNEDLEFTTYYPGQSDRPHLDAKVEKKKK